MLSFVFIFLSFKGGEKNRQILVDARIYKVLYSESLEQPIEVWYEVKCPDGNASRKGMDFYTNDSIHTSSHEDYENNEWDKGHMAPAADFACDQKTIKETFSYLNCALQQQDLNRGAWRLLEAREREIAMKKKVYVHIKLDFSKNTKKLSTGATVPGGFWKEIKYDALEERYYFPNIKPANTNYNTYKLN